MKNIVSKTLGLVTRIGLSALLFSTPVNAKEKGEVQVNQYCTATYEVDKLTKKYTVFALKCASINIYDFEGDSYVDTYCQEDCIQRNKEHESEKEKEKHETFFRDLELFMSWASTQAEIIEIIRKAYEKTEENPPKIEYDPKLMNDAYVG